MTSEMKRLRTLTSNDGPFIGILRHFTYTEEMHLAYIIYSDFVEMQTSDSDFLRILYGIRPYDLPLSDNCLNTK